MHTDCGDPSECMEPDCFCVVLQVVATPRALLEAIVEDDACQFDHHGNCQAHGYTLAPGEQCPQHLLRELLRGAS